MTLYSYNYAKSQYRIKDKDGNTYMDVTKRKVMQKNITTLFTKDVIDKLKTNGKADIGKKSNEYHKK